MREATSYALSDESFAVFFDYLNLWSCNDENCWAESQYEHIPGRASLDRLMEYVRIFAEAIREMTSAPVIYPGSQRFSDQLARPELVPSCKVSNYKLSESADTIKREQRMLSGTHGCRVAEWVAVN